jgi:short-chain Z-isoprenyl diphosphate synthase
MERAQTAGKTRAVRHRGRVGSILGRLSSPRWIKQLLYSLYAQRLRSKLADGPMPSHIALVLDGNRRFARLSGLAEPGMGHRMGTEKVDELLEWCDQLEIPVVTVWILSIDNLSRDQAELDELIAIVEDGLPHLRDVQKGLRNPRRIKVGGRTELLPDSLRETIVRVEQETEDAGPFVLNIALGYGGREEIVDAVKELLVEEEKAGATLADVAKLLTPQAVARHLYFNTGPDPELIIRTSGEVRLGGFMLWKSVYSEYYFCDALWPMFREIDLLRAIRSFQQRKRRFGH